MSGTALAAPGPTEGSFSAQLLPFPQLAAWGDPAGLTRPGCLSGHADVHWHAEEFTAAGEGTLAAEASGFTGDFDLYLLDDAGALVRSEAAQIQYRPPQWSVSLALKPRQTVQIAVCNCSALPA